MADLENNNDRGQEWKDSMLDEANTSTGDIKFKEYLKYYDVSNTIKVAGPVNPHNESSNVYNEERVHDNHQRNAPILYVVNDGTDALCAIVSHGGGQTFSQENVIYPGDQKDYKNVYELRLRSPTIGLPYRCSEYKIVRTCCPTTSLNVKPAWDRAAEVITPGAGAALITRTVTNGTLGYIYGFLISSQETNDFSINWTSGGVGQKISIVFASKGTTQDTEDISLNGLLPADAGTNITITVTNAGGLGTIYQAALLYLEV
jgi:hypothetical protein